MKKTMVFLVVLSLALVGMLSAALALEPAEVVGAWYLQELEVSGMSIPAAAQGMEAVVTFQEDGSATLEMTGEATAPGTWKIDGDTLTVNDATNTAAIMTFTLADGKLVSDMDAMKMIFTQDAPEAVEASPAVVATDLAQFNGDWVGTQANMGGVTLPLSMAGMEAACTITDGAIDFTVTMGGQTLPVKATGVLQEDGTMMATPDVTTLGVELPVTLYEDGTLSFAFTSNGATAMIICEKAEATAQ